MLGEPCHNCDMPDFCKEIGRCMRFSIETDTVEGELTDIEEVEQPELKTNKPFKFKDGKLTKKERQFLKDVINF